GNSGPGQEDPFVDSAQGGAIESLSTLRVTSSSFSHNLASGGNHATATGTDIVVAGAGLGGAIDNGVGGTATMSGSTLDQSQAVGGEGNRGSGPVVVVGTALGGAADSAFGGDLLGATTTTVNNSTLSHNDALGGDNNTGAASVAGLVGVGAGAG